MLTLWDPWHALGSLPSSPPCPMGGGTGFRGVWGICSHSSVSLLCVPQGKGLEMTAKSCRTAATVPGGVAGPVWSACPHTSAPLVPVRDGSGGARCSRRVAATGPPPGLCLGAGMLQLQPPAESWAAAPATACQGPASFQVEKAAAWIWRGLFVPAKGFAIPPPPQFFAAPLSSIQGPAEPERRVENQLPSL